MLFNLTGLSSEPMHSQILRQLLEKILVDNFYDGGDFYDCIPIDERRFGVVIADAGGKGLPAAIIISQIQGMMRSEISNGIEKILGNINKQLVQFTPRNSFATLFYGIFDQQDGNFHYATAGHNYPILIFMDRII